MSIESLANIFKGGRIGGWVARNRPSIETDDYVPEEIQLLKRLSPSFARDTKDLTPEQKAQFVKRALQIADRSPLSATRLDSQTQK